jgi:hypothetical protein
MQKLKLSARTTQVLKNFSAINPSIHVKPGKVLSTISAGKTIMARADVEEEFESEFAIYDISRFLAALSLFKDPELTIDDKQAVISEGSKKMKYVFSDPKTVVSAPDKTISLPSEDAVFKLNNDVMTDVNKVVSVLRLPHVVVTGSNGKITIGAADVGNPTTDDFATEVGETNKDFSLVFKAENIKIMPADYDVAICARGISRFKAQDVTYFIAVEDKLSKFEG